MRLNTDGKPMMSDQEIKFISDLIDHRNIQYCLEWGSGNSTYYFPSKCPSIKKWVSIEHNGHYIEDLAYRMPDVVAHIWVPNDEWYVDCVKLQGPIYDLVLVDGEQRESCLRAAFDLIDLHGYILLHDSGRKEYQGFISEYKHTKVFDGEEPQKDGGYAHRGLTLFRKQ